MTTTTQKIKNQMGIMPAPAAAPAPAPAPRAKTLLDTLNSAGFQKQMRLALPKILSPERLTRIVMTECRKNPALLACNPESFFGAVMQCAQLGLEPGSAMGHCYLLPYGNGKDKTGRSNAQLIIGYRGMIDLARRSGQIISINAYEVHEADEFHYELGLHPDIRHIPSSNADRGPVTYVYGVAQLKGGGIQFEVMSRAEIEAVRASSKAKNGPWFTHWTEMAKKTVVRRLFKYLPVSIETASALEAEETEKVVSVDDVAAITYVEKGGPAPELPAPDVVDAETGEVIAETGAGDHADGPAPTPEVPEVPEDIR